MNDKAKSGRVFWITGLSGAGKTTIGRELYQQLKEKNRFILFLDGDTLREVFGNDLGYSREDRMQCAMRYSRICKMLSEQGTDVIICTISMFDAVREWNREHIKDYIEVYVKVPMDILIQRNQKDLYQSVLKGENKEVVGFSLKLELPKSPDVVIENIGKYAPADLAEHIIKEVEL